MSGHTPWDEIEHKSSPEQRAAAREELELELGQDWDRRLNVYYDCAEAYFAVRVIADRDGVEVVDVLRSDQFHKAVPVFEKLIEIREEMRNVIIEQPVVMKIEGDQVSPARTHLGSEEWAELLIRRRNCLDETLEILDLPKMEQLLGVQE